MIAAGDEDGNDASSLRSDPMFKMAPSDRELCSQSTISRLENLPDARALLRRLLRAIRANWPKTEIWKPPMETYGKAPLAARPASPFDRRAVSGVGFPSCVPVPPWYGPNHEVTP